MSELKATPGPWSVHADVFYQPVIKAPNGFVVATAKVDFGGCERSSEKDAALDTRKANAHLIAAAPELYEAAVRALNYIENTEGELDIKLDTGVFLRAAIAKARGEQS
jgi:hypothetical protein